MKRVLVVVAVVGSLGALFVFGLLRGSPDRNVPSNLIGRPLPSFSLPLYERYAAEFGPTLSLEPSDGLPMVINFWASWCGPCYAEAPHLEAAARRYAGEVAFIGVQTQDRGNRAAGRSFLNQFDFTFPNAIDDDSRVSIAFGLFGVPETFFVHGDGTIAYKHAGPVDTALLDERIAELRR